MAARYEPLADLVDMYGDGRVAVACRRSAAEALVEIAPAEVVDDPSHAEFCLKCGTRCKRSVQVHVQQVLASQGADLPVHRSSSTVASARGERLKRLKMG